MDVVLVDKLLAVLAKLDVSLSGEAPSNVVLKTVGWTLLACWSTRFALNVADGVSEAGLVQSVLEFLKQVPGIAGLVAKEKRKLEKKITDSMYSKRYGSSKVGKFSAIPRKGMAHKEIFKTLEEINANDDSFENGKSKLSGAVYFESAEHGEFQSKVYSRFAATNPIHGDSYPSVVRMDAELVAMTASLFLGDKEGREERSKLVCGSVTSGGSESILCAMKASRDWWLDNRRASYGSVLTNLWRSLPWMKNTCKPEIIMANSAHAAYFKAAEYYNLRKVIIKVGEETDFRLTAAAVRKRITSNTAIIVVSSPTYPHGVVDDIVGIGKVGAKRGITVHVDACLGGYVLAFAEEAGFDRPKFHFGMDGITSMSVDTHKYGMAHKGTSVVLYRNKDIRKYQFTKVTDWSGGVYISPTMAGSRSGGVIAAGWASILSIGHDGFVEQARRLLSLAELLASRIEKECVSLKLLGQPDSSLVAWGALNRKDLDIFKLNDAMSKKGWHLSALQHPPGLHMCITPAHSEKIINSLVDDLKETCEEMLQGGSGSNSDGEEGMAPMYGMAESLPDRNIVGDVLVAFQEANLDC
jgi:sphinganine-1-phosphate aldolase